MLYPTDTGCLKMLKCVRFSVCDLEKVEWGQFEDVDDPGEGSLGAVGEQHDLQTTRHQGTVEDILLQ